MKKIIALILTALITVGCFVPFSSFATEGEEVLDCSTESGFLASVGVFRDSEITDEVLAKKVTRGEFAKKLALLLKTQGNSGDVYFYDTKDCAEANLLAAAGIFKGNPDGFFYPERVITEQEAAIALVRALGYETYVLIKGGNASDYIRMADKLDLFTELVPERELTVSEMAICLYNTLLADVYEVKAITDKGTLYKDDGSNLMWILYDTYRIEGAVTGDTFTELYGESNLESDSVAINYETYKTTVDSPWQYIAQSVTAFVKYDNGAKTVTYISPNEKDSETVILDAGDFTYKDHVIEYYDVKDKLRKITLSDSAAVIKNHQAVTSDYDKAFDIKLGTLTLCKNEYIGSGYCAAIIDSGENALVELSDFAENVVYTSNETVHKIECADNGTNYVEMVTEPSGTRVGAVQLKRGDLVSVFRSENGRYTKLHLCAESVTGNVASIVKKGNDTIAEINGKSFKVSKAFVGDSDIKSGMTAKFFLDVKGDIAYYTVKDQKDGSLYAYVYDATISGDAFENKCKLKLYDEMGRHGVYELADSVKFDGVKLSDDAAYERMLNEGTGKFVRQLVVYNTNKDGQISQIDTAAASKEAREAEGTLWKVAGFDSYRYCNTQHMFYPTYPIRAGRTKVFIIPKETNTSPTEKNFAVMDFDGTSPFNVETSYNVSFYKTVSTDPYTDVLLYAIDDVPTNQAFKNILVADKLNTVYDKVNDKTYINLDCYITTYKTNINFADEVSVTKTDASVVTVDASELTKYVGRGDILQYYENAVGEIAKIDVIYDCDANVTSWGSDYSNYATKSSKYPSDGMILADVADVYQNTASKNSQALITLSQGGIDKEYLSVMPSQFNAIVYDSSLRDNQMYIGNLNDLISLDDTSNTKCSKLFVQRTSMYYTTFVIYK